MPDLRSGTARRSRRLRAAVAGALILSPSARAQVAPPGSVIDLNSATPVTPGLYTRYATTVTAPTAGAYYILFAFREDPDYFGFDDASLTAAGSRANLLANPGFENGTVQSTLDPALQLPLDWGTVYQTGQVPPAAGTVTTSGGYVHGGAYGWDDGSVGSFDGLYQIVTAGAGQRFDLSFWLTSPSAFVTGDANDGIEVAAYFGACGASGGSCVTSLGSGFTVQTPTATTTAIGTAGGDLAPALFSLGSPAAQAAAVTFDGGTLRLTGGAFPGNVIAAPVTITANNGTVDTAAASGSFSGVVSGPGALTVTGGGTFALTGANAYAGGTLLTGGSTLAIGTSSSLGTGALTLDGGTLRVPGGGTILTLANPVQVTATGGTLDANGGGLRLTGAIAGTGALTFTATGGTYDGNDDDDRSFGLAHTNTYAGGSTVRAGASVQVLADGALGSGGLAIDRDGIVDLAGFSQRVTSLTGAGKLVGTGARGGAAGGTTIETLTVQSGAFSGLIASGYYFTSAPDGTTRVVDYGDIDLVKVSDGSASGGTLTLSGANTYGARGGRTLLEAGAIAVGSGMALGTGALAMSDGTTLRLGADGLTLANAVTLAGTDTVDTQDFPGGLGLSGVISGSGTLVKVGSSGLGLDAANTYAGGTVLRSGRITLRDGAGLGTGPLDFAGGTLRAGADGLSVANAAVLATDGTIDTQGFGLTYGGAISGPGRLTKSGTGTLTLTAANGYAGGTALAAGTLAVADDGALGTGPLSMDDGTTLRFAANGLTLANPIALTGARDPTIDTGDGFQTLGGPITGPGALTKLGSGTLDLTGADTAAGPTTVAAGTLLVDGSIASTVTVENGAALGGGGTIGGLIVGGGAVLAPGAADRMRPLSVAGDVTFAAGSTYRVTIDGDGRGSRLAINGAAALGGASLDVLAGTGPFALGTRYTLLSAAGGVSGTFGTLTVDGALTTFLRPTVSYDADDVLLTLNATPFRDVAATSNQVATAGAIQALGPDAALFNAVVFQSPDGARQAFAATSGVSHAGATTAQTQATRVTTNLILDRLWDIGGSGLDARQLLDRLAPDTLPTLVRCYAPMPTATPTPAGYTAWGEAFGDFGHSGNANSGSLDRTLGGFVAGADTEVEGLPGGHGRAGFALGYINTSFRSPLDGGDGTIQGMFGSLYGGARFGAIDVRVGATVGETFNDARRTVAFPGFDETERSRNDGSVVQGFGEVGYRLPTSRFVLEPVAGGAIVHVHQDAFTERGGAAALVGAAQDNDVEITTLGFRGEVAPLNGVPLVAHGFLGWQHAFGDVNPATTLAFEAAATDTFTVTGAPIDRDALAVEASLDWRATAAFTLGLSYTGLVSRTADDEAVKGRAEYRF